MSNIRFDRLRDVLRAIEEAPPEARFDMGRLVHDCGTPACLLGHWLARPDLSPRFGLARQIGLIRDRVGHRALHFDAKPIRDWFGLSQAQYCGLFDTWGCEGARSDRAKATAYLKQWIAEHAS